MMVGPTARMQKTPIEAAGFLFQIVGTLSPQSGYERSFKVTGRSILSNRFLLGVKKKVVGASADVRLRQACRFLEMPGNLLAAFERYLSLADYVHFGMEEGEAGIVYKVYLEFLESLQEEMRKRREVPGPALLHLGLKWDIGDPSRQSITRYVWRPWISGDEILQRVALIVQSTAGMNIGLFDAVRSLISMTQARVPDRDILYLEVTEDGNPRSSFDINVYRAALQVSEVYPLLSMLCRRKGIAYKEFHTLYEVVQEKSFGHLAGGKDRKGNVFFTVYYGAGENARAPGRPPSEGDGLKAQSGFAAGPGSHRFVPVEAEDEEAQTLLAMVKRLGLKSGLEHSFKFLRGLLLCDRFLTGFQRPQDGVRDGAIMNICRESRMPETFQEMFEAELPKAKIILFGFEKMGARRVVKAYLEFTGRLEEMRTRRPTEGVVVHKGFKWETGQGVKMVVTEYRALPVFKPTEIAQSIRSGFFTDPQDRNFRPVDDFLDLAGTRTRPGELLYLQATEEGSSRRSYDVNAYPANLLMSEIYPLLLDAARLHSVDLHRFHGLYESVKTKICGHVSGGFDREGSPVLTFYFSEKGSTRTTDR
jgi:hypothetical protein